MNRRGFFSMLAGAAGAALIPWRGDVDPVVMLPPRGGLWMPLTMREVENYLINDDSLAMRWDVSWNLRGEHGQACVEIHPTPNWPLSLEERAKQRVFHRENARAALADLVPSGATTFAPRLPRGLLYAAHV